MSSVQSLAPRAPAGLETVHNILSSLVSRFHTDEVLTAVRQIPARAAKFRPIPEWVHRNWPSISGKGIGSFIRARPRPRTGSRRQKCSRSDTDRLRQDALLQPAGVECGFRESRHPGPVFISDQSAGAGSAGGIARPREAPRRRLWRLHLRRRYASDARKAIRERGHMILPIRTCSIPESFHTTQMDAPVREPALHRARRIAHLSQGYSGAI